MVRLTSLLPKVPGDYSRIVVWIHLLSKGNELSHLSQGINALVNDSLVGMSECSASRPIDSYPCLLSSTHLGRLCYWISLVLVRLSLSSMSGYYFIHQCCFKYLIHTLVTSPSYNVDGQYTAPLLLFSFLIGLSCCQSFRLCSENRSLSCNLTFLQL